MAAQFVSDLYSNDSGEHLSSTVVHSVSYVSNDTHTCCGHTYRIQVIQSKGVVLVLLWGFIVHVFMPYNTTVHLLQVSLESISNFSIPGYVSENIYQFSFIIFPLMGWIADAKIGRYKTICYSFLCILIASLLILVGYIIHIFADQDTFGLKLATTLLLGIGIFLNITGFACFDANVIPFLIDQALGYSGEKLSALIHWHFWLSSLAELVNIPLVQITQNHYLTMSVIVVHLLLTLAIITSCRFLVSWLDTTPQITNPIKLIINILKYVVKCSHQGNRSALTYWEETIPSRIDLGKKKYGGVFTEEEVEDVKTVLRLVPLIFLSVGFGMLLNSVNYLNAFELPKTKWQISGIQIIADEGFQECLITLCLIVVFHIVVYPFFYNYIPSLLKRIAFGLLLISLSLMYYTVLDPIAQSSTNNSNTCILTANLTESSSVYSLSYYWVLPSVSLGALGKFFIIPFAVEFIVAQTPGPMKGMMVGLWFAFYGIIKLLSFIINYPFHFITGNATFGCTFYYFLSKAIVSVIIFVLFVYATHCYKFRTRDLPINFHLLAENHYTKYLSINSEDNEVKRIQSDIENVSESSSCSSCD